MSCTFRTRSLRSPGLLAGLGLAALVLTTCSPTARAQDRILYVDPANKAGDVTPVSGKITEESKKRIVIKTATAGAREVPSSSVIEVYYQLPASKAKIQPIYQLAETKQQEAGRSADEAKRKELLGEAIKLYSSMQKDVADLKFIKRHVQFKIATLTAHRAAGDKDQTREAVELLEKFQKDNPDSWQNQYADKLLDSMKPKKR